MIKTATLPKKLNRLEPSGIALFKAIFEFWQTPLEFTADCVRQDYDLVCLKLGSAQNYIINEPKLIEEILTKQNQSCIKDISYRILEHLLGNGLLLSHGDTWKYHRRLMQSAFNRGRFSNYGTSVVTHTTEAMNHWQAGEIRDIHREMSLLTVGIILETMFGVAVNTSAIAGALNQIMLRYARQAELFFLIPDWLPTPLNLRANRGVNKLEEIIADIVRQRQEQTDDDLLSILLAAKDEAGTSLSAKDLRDEVMTLLIAGHDTTANALTFTLMLLAQHPEIEAKVVAEIESVIGDRSPQYEDIPHLPYTEMVLKESLRLYPPAWIVGRELTQDCTINGETLPRGTVLYFSQWAVHRNKAFFPNPEQFNPHRWQGNLEQDLPRCAYFPFGAGARVCIGKAFSMMEAVLILATILPKFRFTPTSNKPVELLPSITLRPKHGLDMKITQR